jgi:hypothetical protein
LLFKPTFWSFKKKYWNSYVNINKKNILYYPTVDKRKKTSILCTFQKLKINYLKTGYLLKLNLRGTILGKALNLDGVNYINCLLLSKKYIYDVKDGQPSFDNKWPVGREVCES